MNKILMAVTKFIQYVLNKMNRGSSFPGSFILRFNKKILNYFKINQKTIFITGTTGKTSVTGMITSVYEKLGYKVTSNHKGSNLIMGVISALVKDSNLNGEVKSDIIIMEIDERYVKKVFPSINVDYLIINNLARDQLARNGHFEIVFEEINRSITNNTHLILNADDPLVAKFALNKKNKIAYYGLEKSIYSKPDNKLKLLDLRYCPICHKKLIFEYLNYGNLGSYYCPNHDFERPVIDYKAKILDEDSFLVENNIISMHNKAIYNVYNVLACYTLSKIENLPMKKVVTILDHLSLKVERLTTFQMNDITGTILLSKNETPLSYNQSLEYIQKQSGNKTVAIGFTRISGRYDLKDLSWLYDIHFELLQDKNIEKIILIGPFAYDLAVCLKQCGIDQKKFRYCVDDDETINYFLKNVKDSLYCVFYFDMDKKIKKQLKERGVQV